MFPTNTSSSLGFIKLIEQEEKISLKDRMSYRLVRAAAHIPHGDFLGWQMTLPREGKVDMHLFGSGNIACADLEWFAENVARPDPSDAGEFAPSWSDNDMLYELRVTPTYAFEKKAVGFGSPQTAAPSGIVYPVSFFSEMPELVKALRQVGTTIRYCVQRASEEQITACREDALKTIGVSNANEYADYIGTPVCARALIRASVPLSLRALSIFDSKSSGLSVRELGKMSDYYCEMTWNRPCLEAAPLPAFVACILALEPISYKDVRFDGIPSCKKPVQPIFATHDNTEKPRAITIGQAMDSSNTLRDITIGEDDIRRHWQIVGQTGCGKSTLLATAIISSIKQGYGLSFLDPHGTTIDIITHSLPKEYIDRVHVIHIGDDENPVPLSLWSSGDPEEEELTIAEICALFIDIFDPNNQGIAGPRWERWFTIFAKAALAFLGKYASFESIVALSQSRENMKMLYRAIKCTHPAIASAVKNEFGKDESSEFNAFINWAVSKLQRFTSISQLRKTLGAGVNALDYVKAIDTDSVFLIDLAMPEIGKNAARVVGTMILLQLWQAALTRKHRELTHLVFLDESQLFQSAPLPFMLAEGRKFGLGVIMAHQHCRQMTQGILDALEANSANFTSFRLSSHDAAVAAVRLDDPAFSSKLCRIDAFNAITTLSVDGNQSDPFTLKISPVQAEVLGAEYAKIIEKQSYSRLVKPYLKQRALTRDEIEAQLESWQTITPDSSARRTDRKHSSPSPKMPSCASGSSYVSGNQLGSIEKLASGE